MEEVHCLITGFDGGGGGGSYSLQIRLRFAMRL